MHLRRLAQSKHWKSWACLKPLTNQQYATCGARLRCWLHAYRAGMLKLLSQPAGAPQMWRCCSWCLCFVLTRSRVHCWSRVNLSKFSGFGLFFGFRLQFSCSSVTRRCRNGVDIGAAEKVPRGKGEADGCDGERDAAQEARKQRNHQFGSPPENALGCMFYFAGILIGELIKWILQHHSESTTHLKELYEDKDGLRKDEVALLSGPNEFGEFYSRLRGIKEFYRKHPNEVNTHILVWSCWPYFFTMLWIFRLVFQCRSSSTISQKWEKTQAMNQQVRW